MTTNKPYAAIFSMYLQLPIHCKTPSLPHKNIIKLLHNRLQTIEYKKGMFFSPNPEHSIFYS